MSDQKSIEQTPATEKPDLVKAAESSETPAAPIVETNTTDTATKPEEPTKDEPVNTEEPVKDEILPATTPIATTAEPEVARPEERKPHISS